jgi:hypothetical protein
MEVDILQLDRIIRIPDSPRLVPVPPMHPMPVTTQPEPIDWSAPQLPEHRSHVRDQHDRSHEQDRSSGISTPEAPPVRFNHFKVTNGTNVWRLAPSQSHNTFHIDGGTNNFYVDGEAKTEAMHHAVPEVEMKDEEVERTVEVQDAQRVAVKRPEQRLPITKPNEETYHALVTAPLQHIIGASDRNDTFERKVNATVLPDINSNLISESVVRAAGLYSFVRDTEREDERRYVRGNTYYTTKWVKIRWQVPGIMKHREDIFYVVTDLPYAMVVSSLRQSDAERRLLDETRPDDDEIEVLPAIGPHRSRSKFTGLTP